MTLKEKLENCLQEAVNHHEAAGLSVLVKKDGEDLCYASAGKADIASGRLVERDSIFRLYSQSKPITVNGGTVPPFGRRPAIGGTVGPATAEPGRQRAMGYDEFRDDHGERKGPSLSVPEPGPAAAQSGADLPGLDRRDR